VYRAAFEWSHAVEAILQQGFEVMKREAGWHQILSSAIEQSSEGIAIADLDSRLVYVNPSWAKMHGYDSGEELIGLSLEIFHNREQMEKTVTPFNQVVMEKGEKHGEVGHIRKDGTPFPTMMTSTLLKNEQGIPVAILGIAQDITKRKLAEEKLRLSEKRFSAIMNQMHDAIFISDVNGKFIDANKQACDSLGYSRDELMRLTVADVDPNFSVQRHSEKIWDKLSDEEAITIESRHRRKDGSTYPVEINIGKMELNGEPAILGVARDITQRRQAEDKIQILGGLVDIAPASIMVHDFEGNILYANQNALDMHGYSREEFMSLSLGDLDVPESADKIEARMREIAENGMAAFEVAHYRKDRTHIPLQVFVKMTEWGGKKVVFSIGTDITERKQAEKALQESERVFRNLFNNTEIGMFRTRLDGSEILDANDKFLELLGRRREEVIGKPSTMHWVDPSRRDEMVRLLKNHGRVVDFPIQLLNKKGEVRDCLASLNLNPEEGILDGSILDITERKRAEEEKARLQAQLIQAQKLEAIGTLAGGIAHDFNNILFALLGNTELAKDEVPADSPAVDYLDQAIKAGNRAKELVQQILLFSRKGMGEKRPLQPASVIKEVLKLVRASFPSSIEIVEEIDADCGVILANPTQMHQVLMNLCTNALHAMGEGHGVLTVRLSREEIKEADAVGIQQHAAGIFVRLTVADTGCGMDQATLARIFDPYFTTKDTGRGSGIGLATVHGIVSDCGGFTRVESAPGKGTAFHVYFPVFAAQIAPAETKQETLPGGEERILIVDDEEALVGMYEATLQRLGYRVTACASSLEMLAAFRSSPESFDLVITDQTMPGMAGTELAIKIRQIRPDIPVILCTGYSSMVSEETAEQASIAKFLLKPVSRKDLAVAVREVLDRGRIRES